MSQPESTNPRFDHLVVLMFENRSFDNLLGRLYSSANQPVVDGVLHKDLSNPVPANLAKTAGAAVIHVGIPKSLDTPDPDPGEEHPHTNTQLYGTVIPPRNAQCRVAAMDPPYNAPPDPKPTPTMSGFVQDYINAYSAELGRTPDANEYAQIMTAYTEAQVPVLTTLARGFACFDRWFCEVPSETYPNRSFFHAASSSGFVLNGPRFALENNAETIFNRMEAARPKVSWKVYFDSHQVVSATGLIHAPRLKEYFGSHFFWLEDFFEDTRAGRLPNYSFVEPCMIPPHSDMHPPGAARIRRALPLIPRPAAIRRGEALLAKVYNAVRRSSADPGSNWKNTLLLVTFDEHGGTYDHVPPPPAAPPSPAAPPGEMGFRFDISGVRIPTIAISAWIPSGTVVRSTYRSTSVISTLRQRWPVLGGPLTLRDASAPSLTSILQLSQARSHETWPDVSPLSVPLTSRLFWWADPTLPPLGRHLLRAAVALQGPNSSGDSEIDPETVGRRRAVRHLKSLDRVRFRVQGSLR